METPEEVDADHLRCPYGPFHLRIQGNPFTHIEQFRSKTVGRCPEPCSGGGAALGKGGVRGGNPVTLLSNPVTLAANDFAIRALTCRSAS